MASGPLPLGLLDPGGTAAVLLGASDWTAAGLGRAPSFRRSAKGVLNCLIGAGGLGLDPELMLDLFDDPMPAGDQLARMRDTLDGLLRERREAGRPVADLLVYYVGHGSTDEQGHLALLVRRSRQGLEAETGIKAPDLARVLRVAAPQQRRLVVLDCCFAEAAARAFIGMGGALDQAVAATAAKDIAEALPSRGGLLLCSSPVGEIAVGAPEAERTLFTGALLQVLRDGAAGRPERLSFADLRDAAHERMVEGFGARAPRPVLHPVNQAQGDLSRLPAFPNRAAATTAEAPPPEARAPNEPASRPEHGVPPQPARAEQPRRVEQDLSATLMPPTNAPPLEQPRAETSATAKPKPPNLGLWWAAGIAVSAVLFALVLASPSSTPSPTPAPAVPQSLAPNSPAALFAEGERRRGEGNSTEAVRLYRLAADQGFAAAQYALGLAYATGRGGVAKDEREAVRLYRLAADQGYAPAQYILGLRYELGDFGVAKDEREAARWYRLAADQGFAAAQQALGHFYERGRGGLAKDEREAVRLLRSAADQGLASASYYLAQHYAQGDAGLAKDEREAARWYRRAADQGFFLAQYRLAQRYAQGDADLAKDEREAARWYRLAADQGFDPAQYDLGLYYEQGRGGLARDASEAVRLYQLAARAGNSSAQQRLTQLGQRW